MVCSPPEAAGWAYGEAGSATVDVDHPFFKKLRSNDLPGSRGHQSGLVIPKDLEAYFPSLQVIPPSSTADADLLLDLQLSGGTEVVRSRYQYQTWRGKRAPEARITRGLGGFLSGANPDDSLVFRRVVGTTNRFQVSLVTPESALGKRLDRAARRWGTVPGRRSPATQKDIAEAAEEIEDLSSASPFLGVGKQRATSRSRRMRRGDGFASAVKKAYRDRCAVCHQGLMSPGGGLEIEAAHIVPVSERGDDVIGNGLALCRTHHWAFDASLFVITEDLTVEVPTQTRAIRRNVSLAKLHGRKILVPRRRSAAPNAEALRWRQSYAAQQAQA